jgi:tellurite resistance protein
LKVGIVEEWSRWLGRRRSRPFLDAAMAAAALVAAADRDVRLSERLAVDQLIERLEELSIFGAHACADLHRHYLEDLERDPEAGKRRALETVARFRGDERRALLIVYGGATVARADQVLSEPELQVLGELCKALSLDPDEALPRIWRAT